MASGRVRKIYRVHATSATGRGSCLVIFSKMALSLARVKVHANGRFTPAISTACQRTRTLAFVDSLAGSRCGNVSRCPLAYPIATNRCLNARARDRDGCCSVRGEVALGLEPVCDGVAAALSFVELVSAPGDRLVTRRRPASRLRRRLGGLCRPSPVDRRQIVQAGAARDQCSGRLRARVSAGLSWALASRCGVRGGQ